MTGAFDDDLTEPVRAKGLLDSGLPAVLQEATVVVRAPVGTTLESIPAPRPPSGEGELTPDEKETFSTCKAGMNNLHKAFWVAGKSLETMATGNLHRNEGYTNFAAFVWSTWEISESQMYRLMDGWRIGEALSQLGWSPREAHMRKLVDIRNTAGDDAAVALFDAVARTGKRVTANLLEDVARRLPPLTPSSSPAEIGQMVRVILDPPPSSEAAADPRMKGESAREQSAGPTVSRVGGRVGAPAVGSDHTLDSPIGESAPQPSNPQGPGTSSADLERLNETLVLLREAARSISKPAVRRALEEAPATAGSVLAEIENNLNKIGRAVSVRRHPE